MEIGNSTTYAVAFRGGKDSMLALDRAVREGLRVARLVTLYDEASGRVRFHGMLIIVMMCPKECGDEATTDSAVASRPT